MPQLDRTRQEDVIPSSALDDTKVTIIGAGAIGSNLARQLAKLGISKLVLWDYDIIEGHNLPNQGFRLPDIGKLKVEALKEDLESGYGIEVEAVPDKYTGQQLSGVVVSAVDSMSARETILGAVNRDKVDLFVDGRMASEFGQVFFMQFGDTEWYEKEYMFSDDEAVPERCTNKATIYCADVMSGFMTAGIKNFIMDEEIPKLVSIDMKNLNLF